MLKKYNVKHFMMPNILHKKNMCLKQHMQHNELFSKEMNGEGEMLKIHKNAPERMSEL